MNTVWLALLIALPVQCVVAVLILMKLSELTAAVTAIESQVSKAKDEIVAEINNLQAQLQNVDVPAEASASLDRLKALAQALDDLNPDAPAKPPTT